MSLRTPQLWERALDARRAELVARAGRKVKSSGARKSPLCQVGDRVGGQRVVEILPRDETRKERILAECPNGHRRPGYVENFRRTLMCRECRRQGLASTTSGGRKHPPAKVGDRFGAVRVVALAPRGHHGRSDERVEVICPRGHRRECFVFNLRQKPRCPHCPRSR